MQKEKRWERDERDVGLMMFITIFAGDDDDVVGD